MAKKRGKVALNVLISLEARKTLKKLAIDTGRTMPELVEEMIVMRCTPLSLLPAGLTDNFSEHQTI